MQRQTLWGVRTARAGRLAPLWTGSAPTVTFARQPIRAGRCDAQPISVHNTPGSSVFASAPDPSPQGEGARPTGPTVTHVHPTRPGRSAVPGPPLLGRPYGFGRPERPAGEPPAPVRLRRNVCYVVLAVFLNEQVSVRPSGPPPRSRARSQPR